MGIYHYYALYPTDGGYDVRVGAVWANNYDEALAKATYELQHSPPITPAGTRVRLVVAGQPVMSLSGEQIVAAPEIEVKGQVL